MHVFLIVAALCLLASNALAASATVGASVTVLRPLTMSVTPMTVGTLVQTANAPMNVTLANSGALTVSGGTSISGHSQAVATLAGEPLTAIQVTVDPTITLNGPFASTITATTTNDAASSPTLNISGSATVNVGAVFSLPANAQTGGYSGSFTVTANYQ